MRVGAPEIFIYRKHRFICNDLLPFGFRELEFDPDDPEPLAWCDTCDLLLEAIGERNDELDEFAKIKLVCEFCFAQLREIHSSTAEQITQGRQP